MPIPFQNQIFLETKVTTRFRPKYDLVKCLKGVVSKESVVLRRWGSIIQKIGFIDGVDNVN